MKKIDLALVAMWMSLWMGSGLLACGEMSAEEADGLSALATQEQAISGEAVTCTSDPFWKLHSHSSMVAPGRYDYHSFSEDGLRGEYGTLTLTSSTYGELVNWRSGKTTGRLTQEPNNPLKWIWTSTELAGLTIPFTCNVPFRFKPVASTGGGCAANADCGSTQFCMFDESHAGEGPSTRRACGYDGRRGSCQPRPTYCAEHPSASDVLVGCGGGTFPDVCSAHKAGLSVHYYTAAF